MYSNMYYNERDKTDLCSLTFISVGFRNLAQKNDENNIGKSKIKLKLYADGVVLKS